jgi:hypothetical protein
MSNTIDSKLQLSEVLDSAMQAFERAIAPLNAFATIFDNVPLQGTDKMVVPYYPLATSATQSFAGTYSTLATNTSTEAKEVTIDQRKVQAISFTSAERARQPRFNPVKHGEMKGQKLAFDIVNQILGLISKGQFTGTTIAATAASSFDENDVADLAQYCTDDLWPEGQKSLILNPSFYYALVKRPLLIQADQKGDTATQRDASLVRLLGFDVYGTAGMPTNTEASTQAITGTASTDLISLTAHGYRDGDRIIFPALTGGSGLTAGTTEYFVRDKTADTFKVSATVGGAAVNFTTDISAGTVKRYENLAGVACLPSSILVGFAPISPAEAVRNQLLDYQVVKSSNMNSSLVLEYRHFGNADTDTSYQVIEANFGFALGETAALKRIITA